MQTAVRWLAEAISKLGYVSTDILEQAEEMQKQQMKNAVLEQINSRSLKKVWEEYFDEYYNETYGSKGSDEDLIDAINMARNEPDMSGDDIILSIKQSKSTSSQTEISDEEIEKAFTIGYGFQKTVYTDRIEGAKWYREQLKNKK